MDELSKGELQFSSSLKDLRFLIADPSSSRKSFRALLSLFRVKPHQIDVVDNYQHAVDLLKKNRANVIFADYSLGGNNCFELIQMQQDLVPPEQIRGFFLATSQDSNSMVSSAADESVDAILVKPFTFGIIKEKFVEILTQKIQPSPYVKAIEQGRGLLKAEKYEDAIQIFINAQGLDKAPALACACAGEVLQKLKRHPEAVANFQQGLSHNETHFRCLLGMVTSLMELQEFERAYAVGRTLIEHHTVPMKRIPELIRLSILNKKFEDVVDFYETTNSMNEVDANLSASLSAGLVICGMHFLRRADNANAISAFRKAEVACKQDPKILKRILQALVTAGLEAEMKAFLSRVPPEVQDSPEIRLAELAFLERSDSPHRTLETALRLIKENLKDEKLFETAIRISVQLNRKETLIQDLVWKAVQLFPEKKEHFEALLKGPPSKAP